MEKLKKYLIKNNKMISITYFQHYEKQSLSD